MSIKSFIQIFILLSIILIISVVYYNYFSVNKKKIEEINSSEIINQERIKELEKKILDLEINNQNNIKNFLELKIKLKPLCKNFVDFGNYFSENVELD